jgi:hypothetical protein
MVGTMEKVDTELDVSVLIVLDWENIVSVDVDIISEVSDDVDGEFIELSDVANDELSSLVAVTDPSSVVDVFDSVVSFSGAEVVSSVLVLPESEKVVDDAVLSILDGSLLSVESSVPLTVVDSGFVDITVVLLGSKLIVVSKSIVPVDPSLLNSVDVCDTVKCIDNNKMKR